MFGVRPRSRVGQSLVRCCPGGRRCSAGRAVLPVRKRPSRAQRSLLRVSLLSGGGSWSSAMSNLQLQPPGYACDALLMQFSLVPMHRRLMLGVAHGRIDEQRQEDDAAQIIVEPLLVPEALERERDRGRGAAEYGHRDRIGQADAEGADLG